MSSFALRCQKCETALRQGARRCPVCATPLRKDAGASEAAEERAVGAPLIDPLLALFDRDEMVRTCPECRNEFAAGATRCGACARPLVVVPRSEFTSRLIARPIADAAVATKPRTPPKDARRAAICAGPEEAAARVEEFRSFGIEAWPAPDAAEPADERPEVGLWVRDADLAAADYLCGAGRAPRAGGSAARRGEPVPSDARARDLARARLYLSFGRCRIAIALANRHAGDPEAEALAVDALLGAGRVREAERRAAAVAAAASATERPSFAVRAGVLAALGSDGSAFGAGADLAAAEARLAAATSARPRLLDAGKALLECLDRRRANAAFGAEARRLARVNANLFAHDGWFRSAFSATRAKDG